MSNNVRRFGTLETTRNEKHRNHERQMIEARELPVGSKPGWEHELDQEDALPLKSTSER